MGKKYETEHITPLKKTSLDSNECTWIVYSARHDWIAHMLYITYRRNNAHIIKNKRKKRERGANGLIAQSRNEKEFFVVFFFFRLVLGVVRITHVTSFSSFSRWVCTCAMGCSVRSLIDPVLYFFSVLIFYFVIFSSVIHRTWSIINLSPKKRRRRAKQKRRRKRSGVKTKKHTHTKT